jgi:hypothetical protein
MHPGVAFDPSGAGVAWKTGYNMLKSAAWPPGWDDIGAATGQKGQEG